MLANQIDATLPRLLGNRLPPNALEARWLAGIIGDHPSEYSRSPSLWNSAFARLGLDARYLTFDVAEANLEAFVAALRSSTAMLGVNVTVPYKQRVLALLDGLDPVAQAIGAANCIVRADDGTLVGYNTDAEGALACLVRERPNAAPFFPELADATALLIGSGGAGRAVATALAGELRTTGRLLLANRTFETAREVARAIEPQGGRIVPLAEAELLDRIGQVDLVINASTRGQAGFFRVGNSGVSCLEPYSPLGPARPAVIDTRVHRDEASRWAAWYFESLADIRANELQASATLERVRTATRFFDLIYAPAEPTLLRTARWAGHATLNGSDMILHQAVAGFLLIAGPLLGDRSAERRAEVEAAMRAA